MDSSSFDILRTTPAALLGCTLMGALVAGTPSLAKRKPSRSTIQPVPTIEEVVQAEGFSPTPSHSSVFQPGAVLIPNNLGGHDIVYSECVDVEPHIAFMAQSSVATSLQAGVTARLALARGSVAAGVSKRLTFVDPEQHTIPLAMMRPTSQCVDAMRAAAGVQDLSEAVIVHDVLIAQISSSVCTRSDASGSIVRLQSAEAATLSECVEESNTQVTIGYKTMPFSQALALVNAPPLPGMRHQAATAVRVAPSKAESSTNFDTPVALGVDARLRQQECETDAQERGFQARIARVASEEAVVRQKAKESWYRVLRETQGCEKLSKTSRQVCIQAVDRWIKEASSMHVGLPSGAESVDTACGLVSPTFPAMNAVVVADQLPEAKRWRDQLREADSGASASTASRSASTPRPTSKPPPKASSVSKPSRTAPSSVKIQRTPRRDRRADTTAFLAAGSSVHRSATLDNRGFGLHMSAGLAKQHKPTLVGGHVEYAYYGERGSTFIGGLDVGAGMMGHTDIVDVYGTLALGRYTLRSYQDSLTLSESGDYEGDCYNSNGATDAGWTCHTDDEGTLLGLLANVRVVKASPAAFKGGLVLSGGWLAAVGDGHGYFTARLSGVFGRL